MLIFMFLSGLTLVAFGSTYQRWTSAELFIIRSQGSISVLNKLVTVLCVCFFINFALFVPLFMYRPIYSKTNQMHQCLKFILLG